MCEINVINRRGDLGVPLYHLKPGEIFKSQTGDICMKTDREIQGFVRVVVMSNGISIKSDREVLVTPVHATLNIYGD